jgi:hypothetical protein
MEAEVTFLGSTDTQEKPRDGMRNEKNYRHISENKLTNNRMR